MEEAVGITRSSPLPCLGVTGDSVTTDAVLRYQHHSQHHQRVLQHTSGHDVQVEREILKQQGDEPVPNHLLGEEHRQLQWQQDEHVPLRALYGGLQHGRELLQ